MRKVAAMMASDEPLGDHGRLSLPAEEVEEAIAQLNAAGRGIYMEGQLVQPGHMVMLFYYTPAKRPWWRRLLRVIKRRG